MLLQDSISLVTAIGKNLNQKSARPLRVKRERDEKNGSAQRRRGRRKKDAGGKRSVRSGDKRSTPINAKEPPFEVSGVEIQLLST